jgi:hypothetical protein
MWKMDFPRFNPESLISPCPSLASCGSASSAATTSLPVNTAPTHPSEGNSPNCLTLTPSRLNYSFTRQLSLARPSSSVHRFTLRALGWCMCSEASSGWGPNRRAEGLRHRCGRRVRYFGRYLRSHIVGFHALGSTAMAGRTCSSEYGAAGHRKRS